MSCKKCHTAISYNADIGKYLLRDNNGREAYSTLISDSLIHGYSTLLAIQDVFISDESLEPQPIDKRKLVEEIEPEYVPCFILEIEYDIASITDLDVLETLVPCQSLYYSAAKFLQKGVTSPNSHFCAKVCATEEYTPVEDFADITHVASENYDDCAIIPDPGYIFYSPLNIFGVDAEGKASFKGVFTKDYPGIEPATHKIEFVTASVTEFSYFGICPQGISAYSGITAYVGSRGEIFAGIPSSICVPLCASAAGVYSSSYNHNTIAKALNAYPDRLLITNSIFPEWAFGNKSLDFALPIGNSQRCGFRDPVNGRFYYLNQYETEPIFSQSVIDDSTIVPGPVPYKNAIDAIRQPDIDNEFGDFAIYTHIIKQGVPELRNGFFSIERLPYRETTQLYDRIFKPERLIRDFIVVVPKEKNPSQWVAYSLIRMRKAETDYLPTFDRDTLSLTTDEIGEFVFASCKYGYYEPEAINTNDQLKTAYADYQYRADGDEGINNFAQGLLRDETFSPQRQIGNYGYEPYILPGESRPEDITDCQDEAKHTHSVYSNNLAVKLKHDFITDNEILAEQLLTDFPQAFTLENYYCNDLLIPKDAKPNYVSVSQIGQAINEYLAIAANGITTEDITYSMVHRIKPLAIF